MGTISFTPPTDGSTAEAADVVTPLNTIYDEFNGNIDNANIKANAGISGSKLADASVDLGTKASTWDGWVAVSDSWAYASSTTITVPTDATTKYSVGDKIKLVQSATTKYFYITGVTATVLTVSGGSDYTVANAAISSIYYSKVATPLSFPQYFNWTPTWTNLTTGNGTLGYAKYAQFGKTIHFRLRFVLGSTSAVSGVVGISLPVTAASSYVAADITTRNVQLLDSSSGTRVFGLSIFGSTSRFDLFAEGTAGTYTGIASLSSTVPFTWATSDEIQVSGAYEAA